MTSLTVNAQASVAFKITSAPDGGQGIGNQAFSHALSLQNGTAVGQMDLAWGDTRTLASNTPENIDLSGASLLNLFGAATVFAKVCGFYFHSDEANTTNLTVGAGTALAVLWFGDATDVEIIKPGDTSYHYSRTGWAVTATTADILKVSNASGAAATYDIALFGRSA